MTRGPVHDRPHQHGAMAAVRAIARLNRLQADAALGFGVVMAYPYADRAVIDAALAVRAEDRTSPFAPKPLLTIAMRGIVPAANLARRTKADTTPTPTERPGLTTPRSPHFWAANPRSRTTA